MGEVGLAEARSWGEMNTRSEDGRGQGKGERAVRRRRWGVRVCMVVLETWAQGRARHSRGWVGMGRGVGDDQTGQVLSPQEGFWEGFL